MNRWVLVSVTDDDIKLGVKQKASQCMVARAVKRAFKAQEVVVLGGEFWGGVIAIVDEKTIKLHDKVWNYIFAWDRGQPINPFQFLVKVPHEN